LTIARFCEMMLGLFQFSFLRKAVFSLSLLSNYLFHAPTTAEYYTFPTRRSSDLGLRGRLPARAPPPARRRRTRGGRSTKPRASRSEEHTSELQSRENLVCRLLLEKKKQV